MRRVLALIALVGAVRCTTFHDGCPPSLLSSDQFRSIQRGDQLREQLHAVLNTLAAPDANSAAFAAAGLEPPEKSGQHPPDALRCFTVVGMAVEKTQTPVVVSFELSSRRSSDEPDFVMFASLSDGRWRFTWPARLGPAEIPAARMQRILTSSH